MPLKKYINGSWVDTSYKRYETGTDAVTNLPVEIFTDGQPVSSYTLKGNTSVSGTPSPQNPVTISGVGNETANLLPPPTTVASGEINGITYNVSADGVCTFSGTASASVNITVDLSEQFVIPYSTPAGGQGTVAFNNTKALNAVVMFYNGSTQIDAWQLNVVNRTHTSYSGMGGKEINKYVIQLASGVNADGLSVAVAFSDNGVPVSPFEPYGKYKISILKDLQPLSPIYLNEPLLKIGTHYDSISDTTETREIAKVQVKDLSWEDFTLSGVNIFRSTEPLNKLYGIGTSTMLCDSYVVVATRTSLVDLTIAPYNSSNNNRIVVRDDNYTSASDWKAAMGNTWIYYVLATPTTETVTVPEITTTGGTVTLDVDTTVKPSELDLTYHGWHEHQPLKRENGQWV